MLDCTPDLPQPANGNLPYVFIGDEAFPLKPQLLGIACKKKNIFYYRLNCDRRVGESVFGIMVTKWRILRQPIIGEPDNIDRIVKAVGVLHNVMREKNGVDNTGEIEENGLPNVPGRLGANMYSASAEHVRGSFADYFISPQGSLPY